jgi:flagellar operon protein
VTEEIKNLDAEMLRLRQIQRAEALKPKPPLKPSETAKSEPSFARIFQEKLTAQEVRFSAHAVSRLMDRNISLSQIEIDRIRRGVDKAAEKGAQESLVLMEDKAFVVSVKNRTIITALTGENLKENVFTNIDSAVIV